MASYRGRVTAPASRIIGRIPDGDAEKEYGAGGRYILRSNAPEMRSPPRPPHLGGSSPTSLYSLYQATQASTACDLLANACLEICRSIQSIRDRSTVTFILGLFSIKSHLISSDVLNIFESDVSTISFSEIGALHNDEDTPTSAGHGRPVEDVLHHRAGRLERAPREDLRGILPGHGRHPAGCGGEDLEITLTGVIK